MSRACTSLLNFIRSRPWTPTPDEKEGRTLFDVCHSKRDATCAINPTDGQTFLSTVFDVRPSRRPRFLLATGDTLLLLFRPPPLTHTKSILVSRSSETQNSFHFVRQSEKEKKNDVEIDVFCFPSRTLSRRFPIPLVEGRATESFSSESLKIRFARSWRCHLEKRLFRISLEFRNPIFGTGVCERGKSSSSGDRVRASPFVCFRGFASRETRIRRRRLKKKKYHAKSPFFRRRRTSASREDGRPSILRQDFGGRYSSLLKPSIK